VLTVLGFADPFLAADAVPRALEHRPIGLEGFDGCWSTSCAARAWPSDDLAQLPAGGGFLLVEMGAWTPKSPGQGRSSRRAAQPGPSARHPHLQRRRSRSVWRVRESALGATVFVPGEPDRWEGWEDAAVPPAQLGNYLRKLTKLMAEYGYRSPLYGHYGQGCVHMRINFDFRTEEGLRKFREFIDRAADLVSASAARSAASTATASRARRCCPRCSARADAGLPRVQGLWDPTTA
jgi:FAD/FMN-containing dehydrogenase